MRLVGGHSMLATLTREAYEIWAFSRDMPSAAKGPEWQPAQLTRRIGWTWFRKLTGSVVVLGLEVVVVDVVVLEVVVVLVVVVGGSVVGVVVVEVGAAGRWVVAYVLEVVSVAEG